jgi:hypothetical protein
MSDIKLQFTELPPRGTTSPNGARGTGKHEEIARQLRENPGQWAPIDKRPSVNSASSLAHQVRTAYFSAYAPKGSYEAAARSVDGERHVYARYIGEDGEYA